MLDRFERFDLTRKPQRQKLRLIAWLLSFPDVWKHKVQINKVGMDGIKPPYLMLCNHNAFMDFKIATAAIFPNRANYIVAIDGFLKREELLRTVGCICKRKFTSDILLIRQMQRVVKNNDILVVYPEARYSLCGTDAVLPESLGKLVRLLKVPLVTLIINGDHINSPFWSLPDRGVKGIQATMTCQLTPAEIEKASVQDINDLINKAFEYDEFKWQKDNNIAVPFKNRAKGLHKVLYQCPACDAEYRMNSDRDELWCESCGKRWRMSELGELEAESGETEFSHIPDWYEWERGRVREEILSGKYSYSGKVRIDALPNAKGYIDLGAGTLTHNLNGFTLTGEFEGEKFTVEKPVRSLYSCHIEYDYLGKYGDCVDLNTNTDTFYIYPEGRDFSVTKMSLATEELYSLEKQGRLPPQK